MELTIISRISLQAHNLIPSTIVFTHTKLPTSYTNLLRSEENKVRRFLRHKSEAPIEKDVEQNVLSRRGHTYFHGAVHPEAHRGAHREGGDHPVDGSSWNRHVEYVPAVRPDVDVLPKPNVLVLALDSVEPALPELRQLRPVIRLT